MNANDTRPFGSDSSAELGPEERAKLDALLDHIHEYGTTAEGVLRLAAGLCQSARSAERERNAGWFALVMNAAAALEDAANCLRDRDAKSAAEGAAKHYRTAANSMWAERVGPNGVVSGPPATK